MIRVWGYEGITFQERKYHGEPEMGENKVHFRSYKGNVLLESRVNDMALAELEYWTEFRKWSHIGHIPGRGKILKLSVSCIFTKRGELVILVFLKCHSVCQGEKRIEQGWRL